MKREHRLHVVNQSTTRRCFRRCARPGLRLWKYEGRRKKEEGRRKKEEGRRKKEEGRIRLSPRIVESLNRKHSTRLIARRRRQFGSPLSRRSYKTREHIFHVVSSV